ncbi:hypothetical protein GGD38_007253 [Chitinophagaceae bacterium OAS944]|uniref:hypothetical protein n=2 Tax=Niastella sp. OAS944 TaxID=2664089 RepID=UPI0035C8546B|nr:hypothetical protein [Chitinophagaceae bacterium OAS944]
MMNLKHPYEKHLAEKLVQLPPPDDPDQNWQQMKALLDKNMPRGGGGPRGPFRWWVAGTIIVAVLVGTWFGGRSLLSKEHSNETVAGTIKTVNNKNKSSVASTENNVGQGNSGHANGSRKDLRGATYASTPNSADNNELADNDGQQTVTNNTDGTTTTTPTTGNSSSTTSTAEKSRSSGNNAANANPTIDHNKTSVDRNKIYSSPSKNNKVSTGSNRPAIDHSAKTGARPNKITGNRAVDNNVEENTNNANNKGNKSNTKKPVKQSASGINKPSYKPTITLPSQPSSGSGLKESPVTYNINYTGTTVVSPSGVIQREFTYLFPNRADSKKATTRKSNRNARSHEDRTFAIGLSLPLGFPVGDQQAFAINRNAGVNTISDYIPSPHFQYHFNNKTYLQAGLQFSAPQFIRPMMLYQDRKVSPGPFVHEQITTLTARKLYYFNLPLTVYHSPLKNFYMGAGLQYSSLVSGIAQYECIERSVIGPMQQLTVENYFTKFKNNSLPHKLNGSEVRLLIDMSYYWSRFTVGLQYNQAFNNYASFQITPNSPYTFDKNKSLQFYLRYNIWEDVKRKKPKGEVLTLK